MEFLTVSIGAIATFSGGLQTKTVHYFWFIYSTGQVCDARPPCVCLLVGWALLTCSPLSFLLQMTASVRYLYFCWTTTSWNTVSKFCIWEVLGQTILPSSWLLISLSLSSFFGCCFPQDTQAFPLGWISGVCLFPWLKLAPLYWGLSSYSRIRQYSFYFLRSNFHFFPLKLTN